MKKFIFGLFFTLLSCPFTQAQTVGTIGIGNINLNLDRKTSELRSGQQILIDINQRLNATLSNTRKFKLLDYSELNTFLTDRSLKLESYYEPEHKNAQVDFLLAGLDYILSADVSNLGVYTQKRGSSTVLTGIISIKFTMLGVADATNTFTTEVTGQTTKWVQAGENFDPVSVLDQTIQQGIDKIVLRIVSRLFPIRVMQISENENIRLNYGNGFLKAGDTVFVYNGGVNDIFDNNGQAIAESVATLQVTDVDKRFANAQALSGLENIELRDIGQVLQDE